MTRRLLVTLVAGALASSGPLWPEPPTHVRPKRLLPYLHRMEGLSKVETCEATIRTAYADLEQLSSPSGKELSFELRNFVYIPRDQFDSVRYTDVVTLPGGDTVVPALGHFRATWTDEVRMMVDPSWTTRSEYLETAEGQKVATMSLGRLLDWASREDLRLKKVTGITTYEATVSLGGKQRTYQAAFFWTDKPTQPGERWNVDVTVLDNVTVGVGETLAQPGVVGNQDSLPPPPFADRLASGGGTANTLATKSVCLASSGLAAGSASLDLHQTGTNDHVTGGHGVFTHVDFDCSCTTSCYEECLAQESFQHCEEVGDTGTCHKVSPPSTDWVSGTVGDTTTSGPATCGAGAACAWKACSGCLCGTPSVSFSAGGSGLGISYTASSPDGAVIKVANTHTCKTCVVGAGTPTDPLDPTCNSCSPIVINLGSGPIRLTGLDDPVQFDMDDDPDLETLGWTEGGSDEAFLAYDQNGDGVISHGYELFGNFTQQAPGPADEPANGFRALRVYDLDWLGGDQDGWITPRDAYFDKLRLWFDDNHDGVQQPNELFRLADYGIEAIELDYKEHQWRDRHGNRFRFSSRVRLTGGRTTRAADVFLVSPSQ